MHAYFYNWPGQEFAQLTPDNVVFKLIGPVLVKQEQNEAKSNVETRLEFIRGEMFVVRYVLICVCATDYRGIAEKESKFN